MPLMPLEKQLIKVKQFYYKYYFSEFSQTFTTVRVFLAHFCLIKLLKFHVVSQAAQGTTVIVKRFTTLCKI